MYSADGRIQYTASINKDKSKIVIDSVYIK